MSFIRRTCLVIAAVLALNFLSAVPSLAQVDEATALTRQAEELYKAQNYADAIPLAEKALAIREKTLGPDDPQVASALNRLARLYVKQGRYADAEPLYRRALKIRERIYGSAHPFVAFTVTHLAEIAREQKRYAETEELYRRALAIREQALGPNYPDLAQSVTDLAEFYVAQGRAAEAEPLFRRAIALYENVYGPEHRRVAAALSNLAGFYRDLGRYAEAEPLYQHALAMREKGLGPEHPDVAATLNDLAELYNRQARIAEAETLYQRALAMREKTLGPEHPDVATTLNGLAELYDKQGRYADAEPLYHRALAIREKTLGPDHLEVAQSLLNLAQLCDKQRRYAEAESLYTRALAIDEKALGPDHPDVAVILTNLGKLYGGQHRYAEAEPLIKRALAIREKLLGPNHPEVAALARDLSSVQRSQAEAEAAALDKQIGALFQAGKYAEAIPLAQQVLAIREKAFGPEHPDVASSLTKLADLYYDQRRYADAAPLLERALAIYERALGSEHTNLALLLGRLAVLFDKQGRYADAEPLLKRALAMEEKALGPEHPAVADALNNLAGLYRSQGRYAEALPIVRRLIKESRAPKYPAFSVLMQARAENLIDASQALIESYEVVQRASSSAAGAAVSKLAARFAAGPDMELANLVRQEQDLTVETEQLDNTLIAALSKPAEERDADAEDRIRKRIEAIKAARGQLEAVFNERFPDYVALAKPKPLSVEDTQKLLADDEALIVFDFGVKSYVWVITRDGADWQELNITARDLAAQVSTLRESLTSPVPKPFDAALAHKIYQSTFGALASQLAVKKRLSVVTNGAFTSLPPQLLVTQDPTGKDLKEIDWLVRSYAVTILPSVMSLQVMRRESSASAVMRSMVAFADPVFADALPQLPGTRKEVETIGEELKVDEGDLHLGSDASETTVKGAKLDQYKIVYFATHGLLPSDIALVGKAKPEPALALSKPATPSDLDDGLLQASEIAQLKLNAEWVVLSACNTAAEDKPGAEALSGLARAFFYAGARSLLVSHWEADDAATARLMATTFKLHEEKPELSHAEVLQQAMLAMLDEAKSDAEAHPRLWAPFVVMGEPAKPQN